MNATTSTVATKPATISTHNADALKRASIGERHAARLMGEHKPAYRLATDEDDNSFAHLVIVTVGGRPRVANVQAVRVEIAGE